MLTIGLLTSSRSDYGIYMPLIRVLHNDPEVELNLLVFGTHLSDKYGKTIDIIKTDGFNIFCTVDTLAENDGAEDIALSMAKTITGFKSVWQKKHFNLIFALGDRYEMFAAVASSVPFNIPVTHIHGGETTLGAIDNTFRHSISCMANYHFTSTDYYSNRVKEIIGRDENVYNVGALSIDTLKQMQYLLIPEFREKYGIDLSKPTILITFHPETIDFEENIRYVHELVSALSELKDYQQVITMPNADTKGLLVREELIHYANENYGVFCIESFGSLGYLSCMKQCSFMLGNSSSGFVEASFFAKPVINIGKRQRGRIETPNIVTVPIEKTSIINASKQTVKMKAIKGCQIYGNGNAAKKIVQIIKSVNLSGND